jgi:tetratricopeptide (TPR) repeat protein
MRTATFGWPFFCAILFAMNQMRARQLAHEAQKAIGQGHWQEADGALVALESIAPSDAWVKIQRSYVQSWQGHYRSAHGFALSASELPPPNAETISDVAWRLRTFNEASALETYVRRLGNPAALPLEVLPDIAAQFSQLNRFEQARDLLEIAHGRLPTHPAIAVALAQSHAYLGAFEEARRLILVALKLAPNFAEAWWQLSTLPDEGQASHYALELQSRIDALPADDSAAKSVLLFALHRFLDSTKAYDAAGVALVAACRLRHDASRVDAQAVAACTDALIQWHPEGARARAPADAQTTPVFILGMHRSGTTLLEQLLSAHTQVRGGGELYDLTAAMREATDHHCKGVIDEVLIRRAKHVDFSDVGASYIAGVCEKLNVDSHFTDKLPTNFFNIGFICEALPEARILHLVRDPMEVCFSNLRELFADVNFHTYDADAMADYYANYLRLMTHWRTRYPDRIMDVHYTQLTQETEKTMRSVSTFCGLAYEEATLSTASNAKRGIATASVSQVRAEVTARRAPKWKPYAPYLQDMMAALQHRGIEFQA